MNSGARKCRIRADLGQARNAPSNVPITNAMIVDMPSSPSVHGIEGPITDVTFAGYLMTDTPRSSVATPIQ